MAPGPSLIPCPRTKRVSAQHTLERVRNNQRQHRARRKNYIVTLEQRLREAEETISALKDQVEALQAALTRGRGQPHVQNEADCRALQPQQPQVQDSALPQAFSDTHDEAVQAYGVLSDTEDLGAWELSAAASPGPLVSDDQPGLEVNAVISPPSHPSLLSTARSPEFIPALSLVTESASDQAVTEAESLVPATAIQDQIVTATTLCCSSYPSSDSQLNVNTIERMTFVPSLETPLSMPEYLFQPVMEGYYQQDAHNESTILCSEAYIIIAQQNFKGMSQEDVTTWLWNGFRRSLRPGEGCRVNADMLLSLLAFISDT
ncbi:hypothetical protein DL766_003941 [Monosporascus sp. MC13-8B]|uniref:BZIP domain-containing protein n=1 Tax=Monosporascus cannonballus TaxID=155416 RepID=A0ABY0HLS4_9PEZI|nr:hypothetical protein DL762_001007 [Monosporascus cannonballus]RYP00077.1 hypothetical protein DL763_001006 [Monosporascus cannonballus]RYP32525.1 hypothetical protein DL766_003941 [Monosporascus sp. MC13-8B]